MNDKLFLKYLRWKSLNTLQNKGHVGTTLSSSPILYVLFFYILKIHPDKTNWINRDRLVIANSWNSAFVYNLLKDFGFTNKNLENYRNKSLQETLFINKKLNIELATGTIGQGLGGSVGIAIGLKYQAEKYNTKKNKIINNKVYCIVGDGEMMEGVSNEAMSIAGNYNLHNLIVIYDANQATYGAQTKDIFIDNIKLKTISMNWNFLEINHENINEDPIHILKAFEKIKELPKKPTLIKVNTIIAYNTKFKGYIGHSTKFDELDIKNFNLSISEIENLIPYYEKKIKIRKELIWSEIQNHNTLKSNIYKDFTNKKKIIKYDNDDVIIFSEKITNANNFDSNSISYLNLIVKKLINDYPNVIITTADAEVKANLFEISDYNTKNKKFQKKLIQVGLREHSLSTLCNGLNTLNYIPVVIGELPWIDYAIPAIRTSAKAKHKVIYYLNRGFLNTGGHHGSFFDILSILRSIPNLNFFKPANNWELSFSTLDSLKYEGPSIIVVPFKITVDKDFNQNIYKGGYDFYLPKSQKIKLIIVTTGYEVYRCKNIIKNNNIKNVKIVSMLNMNLFDQQSLEYKNNILPNHIKKISIEIGSTFGWDKYVNKKYGIDDFLTGFNKIMEAYDYYNMSDDKIKDIIKKELN